jgi:K+-transporting ATPase ATPase A chain
MFTELTGVLATFLLTLLLAYPLGRYVARMFAGERTLLDFLAPLEGFIFRVSGIDPHRKMDWKEFLKAMLTINLLWFVYAFFMFLFQSHLPLNPDGNPDMTPTSASTPRSALWSTVISRTIPGKAA